MSSRNWVAKHMNTFNRSAVEEDKRNKWLDDQYEREVQEWSEEPIVYDDKEDYQQ